MRAGNKITDKNISIKVSTPWLNKIVLTCQYVGRLPLRSLELKFVCILSGPAGQILNNLRGLEMIQLRQYQIECLEAIKKYSKNGKRRLLVSMPTGSGKTVVFSKLIQDLNCRTLVLAHTCELLEQAKEKIQQITGLEVGLVNQEHKEFDRPIVVSSIQSAMIDSNLQQLCKQKFQLLIYDESHRAASDGARYVLKTLGFGPGTKKLLVGFTATPFRHDKTKGLAEVFDDVPYQVNIQDLIDHGYLVPPVGYLIANDLDLSHVPTVNGEFKEAALSQVVDCPDMIEGIVSTWLEKAEGRKTIAFGVNVAHSLHIAECFNQHGITAKLVSGETDHVLRRQYLESFKNGDLMVLCNAQVLVEGLMSLLLVA